MVAGSQIVGVRIAVAVIERARWSADGIGAPQAFLSSQAAVLSTWTQPVAGSGNRPCTESVDAVVDQLG
jgi:hypothetical protein